MSIIFPALGSLAIPTRRHEQTDKRQDGVENKNDKKGDPDIRKGNSPKPFIKVPALLIIICNQISLGGI